MKKFATLCLVTACLLVRPTAKAAPELGLQAWTFRHLTFVETLDQAQAFGIHYVQAFPGQKLGGGLTGEFSQTMDPSTLGQLLALAKARGVTIASYGVITPKNNSDWPVLFAFARAAGLTEIVTEAKPAVLAALAPSAEKYQMKISLHDHPEPSIYARPETALGAIAKLGNRFGLCADTGHWARTGLDPVACLRLAKGRINSLHFKDIAERGRRSRDLPWGTGTSNAAGQLAELRQQGFNGIVYLEYEHDSPALFDDVGRCAAFFQAAMKLAPDALTRGQIAPPGFSTDVRAVFAPGRGRDSERWPAPQPLFAPDLSNGDQPPGAWAFNAAGILAPTRAAGAKPSGELWTKESYGDFVVSLEFRVQEKTASGVLIRASEIANWPKHAIEVQILQGNDDNPARMVGALRDVAAPARPVPITPGEWYRCVITAKDNEVTVMLNGEEVNNVKLDQWENPGGSPDGRVDEGTRVYQPMARTGRIGLRDQGSPIEFRHLFIERL